MGKSSPSPPQGVDPVALSNAQTTSNIKTANALAQLNRINQTTPWGTTTYTHTPGAQTVTPAVAPVAATGPTNSDGSTNANLTQGQRDDGVTQTPGTPGSPGSPAGTASDPNAVDTWSQDTTLNPGDQALLEQQRLVKSQGNLVSALTAPDLLKQQNLVYGVNAPKLQTSLDMGNIPQAGNVPTVGNLQTGAAGGPIQAGLDFSGAPAMPTADTGAQQAVVDALYGQSASRLDPQWQQDQTRLETQLANQGVVQNSDAWNKAMDEFQRNKTDAYATARNSAIGAGTDTLSKLFGMGLSARQQGVGETTAAGTFANAAENQLFGQNTSNAALNNAAEGQSFTETLSAQQQQFAQQLAAEQQGEQERIASMTLGNQAQQQGFGNDVTNANLNNSTSQMSLQDLLSKYGLGSGNITMPGMPAVPQAAVAPTDVIGAQGLSSNNAMALYQQQMQNNSAAKGGAGSLLGTGAMAAGMFFSDRHLKTDMQIIGRAANGLPIYSFRYVWSDEPEIGLMAQDVEKINPAAVHTIAGFKAVEYPAALA